MTWMERLKADPSLRAFVEAEIARAQVRLQSLEVEVAHKDQVIQQLLSEKKELEQVIKGKAKRT
jgi:septal ring factor EnvC (AmiA/AmiB activator)